MKEKLPIWTNTTLLLAGIYNLLWGAWVVLFPATAFDWLDVDRPKYLELWQCIGMIVGCYGIAYLIAATDPASYWPITLVGLIGKVAGPIGFVQALWTGVFPLSFGWLIIFNDLIWWIPFTLILWLVYRNYRQPVPQLNSKERLKVSSRFITSKGRKLDELDASAPMLLVFLRHSGCTFCRQMLADLKSEHSELLKQNIQVVVAHMSSTEDMDQILASYELSEVEHVSDPAGELYRAYGLEKGTPSQLFGPDVWCSGLTAGIREGHGVGWLDGDGFQMPGVFLVQGNEIKSSFIHRHAGERPDYLAIAGSSA